MVKEVVHDQDVDFANHEPPSAAKIVSFEGNDIAFRPYGDEWKKLRKINVREMLSKSLLDSLYGLSKYLHR